MYVVNIHAHIFELLKWICFNLYLQPLVKKDKERELKKKNAELQSKMENLEKKCAVLEVNKKNTFFLWILDQESISSSHVGIFKQQKTHFLKNKNVIVWNTNMVVLISRSLVCCTFLYSFFSKDTMCISNVPGPTKFWSGFLENESTFVCSRNSDHLFSK